jgi:hypothetical protein
MKNINRRDFIHAGCTAAAVSLAPHFMDVAEARLLRGSAAVVPSSGGQFVLDLQSPSPFAINNYPFVNMMKNGSGWIVTASNTVNSYAAGVTFRPEVPQGAQSGLMSNGVFAPSAIGVFLDANGEPLATQPSGAGTISFTNDLGGCPPSYQNTNITLNFSGGGAGWTVTLQWQAVGGSTLLTTTSSGQTFTLPTGNVDPTGSLVISFSGTGNNPPYGFVMAKTANIGMIAAGNYWDPDYVNWVKQASWAIRTMDIDQTNNNNGTYDSTRVTPLAASSWAGTINGYTGVPLAVEIALAKQTGKHIWKNLPFGTMGRVAQIQSITNAATPTVNFLGPCPYSVSDQIYFTTTMGVFSGGQHLNASSFSTSGNGTFTSPTGAGTPPNNANVTFGVLLLSGLDSNSYPTGLTKGTRYYVINSNPSTGTWNIAPTPGGSQITLTGSASGTINVVTNYGIVGAFARIVNPTYSSGTWTLNGHGLVNGTEVVPGVSTAAPYQQGSADTSTYPSWLTKLTRYYVINATTNTFQLSTTPGGSVAGTTGSMTGTANIFISLNTFNGFTVASISGNTCTISGIDTTGFIGACVNDAGNVSGVGVSTGVSFRSYTLSDMTTNVASIANYFLSNMPSGQLTLYEFSNEIWNPVTGISQYFNIVHIASITQTVAKFVNNGDFVAGYLMAAAAYAVYQVYGSANRSKYKMHFGNNQTGGDRLAGACLGAAQFITDNPSSPALTALFDYLPMASYLGHSYFMNAGYTAPITFGSSTVAFPSGLKDRNNNTIANDLVGVSGDPLIGLPIKLNVDSPVGTLPALLAAGTLSTAPSSGNPASFFATISGNVLTVLYKSQIISQGTTNIEAGMTLVSSNPDQISGLTINAYGSGGTTGLGAQGTYQLSGSPGNVSTPTLMFTGPLTNQGTGTVYWIVGIGPNYGLATTPGGSPSAFTGGTGSNTACVSPLEAVQYLMAQSKSLHSSSPVTYPHPWTYYGDQIGQDLISGKWTGVGAVNGQPQAFTVNAFAQFCDYYNTNYTAVGKPLAGSQLICYEGGSEDIIIFDIGTYFFGKDPNLLSAWYYENFSSGQATAYMSCYTQLVQSGKLAKLAQFQDMGIFTEGKGNGTYGASQYVGDTNARWNGIVAVNALP